jgi:hypothetical protein
MKNAPVRPVCAGWQAFVFVADGNIEVTATGRTPAIARKNLARELERYRNPRKEPKTMRAIDTYSTEQLDELRLKGMLNSSGPIKTIWDKDAEHSTEPLLICAPSHEDIQRMAGFPVDDEDRAIVEDDERVRAEAERFGAESEAYNQEEVEARREAANNE